MAEMPAIQTVTGCFGLIDALGFKQYRERRGNVAALSALESVRQAFKAEVDHHQRLTAITRERLARDTVPPVVTARSGSDSVSFVVATPDATRGVPFQEYCMWLMGRGIARAMRVACRPPDGLAWRGVITSGEFAVSEFFAVGEAMEEAAELHEKALGAFVWLSESCLVALGGSANLPRRIGNTVVPWKVPLHGGREVPTYAVTPFHDEPGTYAVVESDILATFDRTVPSVATKHDNTRNFLLHAKREAWRLADEAKAAGHAP